MEAMRILLVEDSPTQARFASLLLECAGYRVSVAIDGSTALEMAESDPPDLILLDVVLPDMDGFTVCRRLRQRIGVYLPILMFTEQRTGVEDRVDGLNVGADDYLAKPFDRRELLARVAALLRVKQVMDELRLRFAEDRQSYQALKRIALTDHVTGLYNRRFFDEVLDREFALARRHHLPLSCVVYGIDCLESFAVRQSQAAADRILQAVASLVQISLVSGDVAARFGATEIATMLPVTSAEDALSRAEHVRGLVRSAAWPDAAASGFAVTVSAGVAGMPDSEIDRADVLSAAAAAALRATASRGRDAGAIHEPA